MAKIEIKITDNSKAVKELFEQQVRLGLEAIGQSAVGFAKDETPVDTGRLRNSLTYSVLDMAVYIGTNVEYAVYVEYRDKTKSGSSVKHKTGKAHFLRDAAANHGERYKAIMKAALDAI